MVVVCGDDKFTIMEDSPVPYSMLSGLFCLSAFARFIHSSFHQDPKKQSSLTSTAIMYQLVLWKR